MIRVLCFCGFTSNQYLFSQELSRLQRECIGAIDFVFLDPPTVVEPIDPPADHLLTHARPSTGFTHPLTPETTPRRWYDGGADWHHDIGFADGLAYVHGFLIENEPFDGLFAFSSGAVLAVVVAALLQSPHHSVPDFPPTPLSARSNVFFISCAGFFPSGRIAPHPTYIPLFPLPASLATLHVIGKYDTLLPHAESLFLAEACCANSRVEWHDGNHFVPMKAAWRGFFRAWMVSFAPGGSQGQGIPPVNTFSPAFMAKQPLAVTIPSAVPAPVPAPAPAPVSTNARAPAPSPISTHPPAPAPSPISTHPPAPAPAPASTPDPHSPADSSWTHIAELPLKLCKELGESSPAPSAPGHTKSLPGERWRRALRKISLGRWRRMMSAGKGVAG